jgi:hypothetical protein
MGTGQLSRHGDYVMEGGPVRFPAETRHLCLRQMAQTDPGAFTVHYSIGTEGTVPRIKCCAETSVISYQPTPPNIPEERRLQRYPGESLKISNMTYVLCYYYCR